jgi:glycerophosphoryl diester phosphodiesterase
MSKLTRREMLILGGGVALGATAAGVGIGAALKPTNAPGATPSTRPRVTYESWLQTRRAPYYIGHRGAGDVAPEHSLPSYQTALDWGADALEISVVKSSDDVLFCLHDLALDRTTTLSGPAAAKTSAQLDLAKVRVPRLGPSWLGARMPPMPRLDTVLQTVGGRAVLCIEPKDDSAYPLLIELVRRAGLLDTLMVKLDAASPRIAQAKKDNLPVFAYLGNDKAATPEAIAALARRLDPARDALVLPAPTSAAASPSERMRRAVGFGVPVWVFPVHRRAEVRALAHAGVEGMITPDTGYVSGTIAPQTTDDWRGGAISAGELTRDPYSDGYAIQWGDEGVIGLDFPNRQAFLTLGQVCPITAQSYRVSFDLNFDPLPSDTWQHVSLAFGQDDDRYYEHRLGDNDGYHVLLRADGTMSIYAHVTGDPSGQLLVQKRSTGPLKPGVWSRLTLDVTPQVITWTRDDGTTLQAKDSRFRGGYLHIGRSSNDGRLNLRNLAIG